MPTIKSLKKFLTAGLLTALFVGVGLAHTKPAEAAVTNTTPEAKISFTFDDGPASDITTDAPALAQYGYTGTAYVITKCVGMVTIPNKCPADTSIPYMDWAQVKALQNTYGWEIGSHSVSHKEMSTITAKKLETEVANSKAAFNAQGLYPTAFATPYGDYNSNVLAAIAKYYSSHRGFADTGYNTWPYNNYLLRVQQVQYGVSVDTVKSYIDQAVANHTWLILVFHEVRDTPSTVLDDYQYATADLSSIAAYAKHVGIKGTNITNGLVTGNASDNQITDPVSGTVIGNGWNTDVPANVAVNTKSNGNNPEPTTSVEVKASTTATVHLFGPSIAVNPASTYVIKGYVNITAQTSGSIGVYIDEYDANGNWISGQYKQTISAWYMKDMSFSYTPTSSKVATTKLQIIVTANSGITAYIDSVQWLTTTAGPAPTPDPIPVPVENLMTNGTFESGMTGWTTDTPSAISLDTANHGSGDNISSSVKLTNVAAKNSQLFSSKVQVSSANGYNISAYLNVVSLSQDIGFYVDEYDANGNWISGQYLFTKHDTASGIVSFNYTPSSVNVANASLQVIMVAGTGTTAYIDNVVWAKN